MPVIRAIVPALTPGIIPSPKDAPLRTSRSHFLIFMETIIAYSHSEVVDFPCMKTLILYCSKTGNTKTYALDLAKAVDADVYPLKKLKPKKWLEYDTIVFGGWIMGGTIQGLDKFLQSWDLISDKNVIVFADGMGVPDSATRTALIEQNVLDIYHIRFYQLRGSFDFKKLKFPYSFLLNNTLIQMQKDPKQAETAKALESFKDCPLEYYDHEKMDRMISVIRSLAIEVPFEEKK
ncbi:MAG TPA: hypothetical protein DCZ41_05790 [Firmicutes bacterium]|nr:hypothetical protein [Bacillota bacterium]